MSNDNIHWKFIGTLEYMSPEKKAWLAEHTDFLVDDFDFVYVTEELLTLYVLRWSK